MSNRNENIEIADRVTKLMDEYSKSMQNLDFTKRALDYLYDEARSVGNRGYAGTYGLTDGNYNDLQSKIKSLRDTIETCNKEIEMFRTEIKTEYNKKVRKIINSITGE